MTASFGMLGDITLAEPKGVNRICGATSHRADHRTEASGRIPEIRVPVGAWIHRPDCGEGRDERRSFFYPQYASDRYGSGKLEAGSLPGNRGGKACPYKGLTSWERVQISRKKERPVGSDYIRTMFTDSSSFMETVILKTIKPSWAGSRNSMEFR